MTAVKLYPARQPWTDPKTGLLTREAFQALDSILRRLGGASSDVLSLDELQSLVDGFAQEQFLPPAVQSDEVITEVVGATQADEPITHVDGAPEVSRAYLPVSSISPGASPYTYTVEADADVIVQGGTVSAIAHLRQGTSTTTGQTAGMFRLSLGDALVVTYSVTPTMTLIPR